MASSLASRAALALCVAVAGCATKPPVLDFEQAPRAHVAAADEAIDPAAAYVVVVPHVASRSGPLDDTWYMVHVSVSDKPEFLAWLTSAPPFGQAPVNLAVAVSTARPTVVRVPPGRWFVSKVFVQSHYYDVDPDYSLFDARSGQLNYPGDWTVEAGYHESTRGALHIGWYFNATLAESDTSDLGAVLAEGAGPLGRLPRAYTRLPSARPAPGGG
ncbi:hypothetical protein [Scleromatobacter humisilvae]|uniref:Uncharacterized protein n=1 Tax=Scleromatobacter humisilvae TaxID=2897159 RepID=A0A9X1YMN8_9BURK|nr:hypothetical protein [Scleromatobacter humisilvae]MCK9688290.1 hypothetical protein [Scleromatobacter humisilvae]